jgi:hypothetical protein
MQQITRSFLINVAKPLNFLAFLAIEEIEYLASDDTLPVKKQAEGFSQREITTIMKLSIRSIKLWWNRDAFTPERRRVKTGSVQLGDDRFVFF